tara:strand:- start:2521 stop:3627 length:1107 start_codon:yes stop_codon:yes gene_type:complete
MFELLKTDGAARRGRLTTERGVIETPMFMPVGTQGTVKAMAPGELHDLGAQVILGNTYHLNLRPGMEVIREAGGLHQFMDWPHPILTDSGGFQVFSLSKIRRIRENGVEFKSYIDGAPLFLGPVEAMEIQRDLGSDVAMVFDDCPSYSATATEVSAAVERTLRWAATCLEQPRAKGQLVFGIGQGGVFDGLRRDCASALVKLDFDGFAIGGLSVGESEEEMLRMTEVSAPLFPASKPRYAMGLGTPAQLVELVARGVDLFDCVLPTRAARHGTAYTRGGHLNLKAARFRKDFRPIEENCECSCCARFTRAYLRHLIHAGEILGQRLLTEHNLACYLGLMTEIRVAIEEGTFENLRKNRGLACQKGIAQ